MSKDGSGGTKVVDPPISDPIVSNSGGRNTIANIGFDDSFRALAFQLSGGAALAGQPRKLSHRARRLALLTQYDASRPSFFRRRPRTRGERRSKPASAGDVVDETARLRTGSWSRGFPRTPAVKRAFSPF